MWLCTIIKTRNEIVAIRLSAIPRLRWKAGVCFLTSGHQLGMGQHVKRWNGVNTGGTWTFAAQLQSGTAVAAFNPKLDNAFAAASLPDRTQSGTPIPR